jgi:hypothetical protein
MNNSFGYIRLWEPFFGTGAIMPCAGDAHDMHLPNVPNIAFRFASINDPALQDELQERPRFLLPRNCDPGQLPPATLWVSFFYDGDGFAMNILPHSG